MNKWLRLFLQFLSLVLFILILYWAGPETVEQVLRGDRQMLFLAFLVYGGAGIISAARLQLATQALSGGKVASWGRFYYLNMTARVLGLILPRGLSTLGGKSVGLRALGIPLWRSIWTVMVDNLYDVLSLGLGALPAIFLLQNRIQVSTFILLTLFLWLLLALGIWWAKGSKRLLPLFDWLLEKLPWLKKRLPLEGKIREELFPPTRAALGLLLWTIILNVFLVASYYLIGRAVNVSAPWWVYAASFPITQLSLIVAVAPGGLGIFDLGWLGLLHLGGVSQEAALTFVVAQRAYIFVFVLFWAATSVLLSFIEREGKKEGVQ